MFTESRWHGNFRFYGGIISIPNLYYHDDFTLFALSQTGIIDGLIHRLETNSLRRGLAINKPQDQAHGEWPFHLQDTRPKTSLSTLALWSHVGETVNQQFEGELLWQRQQWFSWAYFGRTGISFVQIKQKYTWCHLSLRHISIRYSKMPTGKTLTLLKLDVGVVCYGLG